MNTWYYMLINVNCEHSRVDKGKYCYELYEEDYQKIVDAGEVLME